MCHVSLLADCMDCIANCIFDFSSYSNFLDGFPFHVPLIVSPCSPALRAAFSVRAAVSSRYRRSALRSALLAALSIRRPSPRLLLAFFHLPFVWRITVSPVPPLSPSLLADGRGDDFPSRAHRIANRIYSLHAPPMLADGRGDGLCGWLRWRFGIVVI